MAILTIALALALVGGTSLVVVLRQWAAASRLAADGAPGAAAGTEAPKPQAAIRAEGSVTLPIEQVSPDSTPRVARGTIAPPVRRRLPGLMPTEGHSVVTQAPSRPTPRTFIEPKAMDFSDEN